MVAKVTFAVNVSQIKIDIWSALRGLRNEYNATCVGQQNTLDEVKENVKN